MDIRAQATWGCSVQPCPGSHSWGSCWAGEGLDVYLRYYWECGLEYTINSNFLPFLSVSTHTLEVWQGLVVQLSAIMHWFIDLLTYPCLSTHWVVYLAIYLLFLLASSIHPSSHPSIYLTIHPSIYPFIYSASHQPIMPNHSSLDFGLPICLPVLTLGSMLVAQW